MVKTMSEHYADDVHMTQEKLQYFEKKLKIIKKNELQNIYNILLYLREEGLTLQDINQVSSAEEDIALKCQEYKYSKKIVNEVDHALEKIKSGDYGYCEDTGEPIKIARLEVIPTARLSVEAQEIRERKKSIIAKM